MNAKRDGYFHKFQLLLIRIKHGLFLMTVRNLLVRVGLNIGPYYWVLEGANIDEEPKIKGTKENYDVSFLTLDDIKNLESTSFVSLPNLIARYESGVRYTGLKHKGETAAFMSISHNDFTFRKKVFKLKDNEVYLSNMYTYQSFRGKSLAPYLRYQSYQLLKKEGVEYIYSVTDYFNKSSQKFKKKLNAKPLTLYFAIILFKKYHKTIKIKDYKN